MPIRHRYIFDEGFLDENEPAESRPQRLRYDVLFKDTDILIVNKPPGVSVDEHDTEAPSLLQLLTSASMMQADAPSEPVYMLDAPVSGAIVFARTQSAAAALDSQLHDGTLVVTMRVIVRGPVLHNTGESTLHVGFVGHGPSARMRVVRTGGYDSVTRWKIEDRFVGFALLECNTSPPLPHQVRLHLSHQGIPLAVDPSYGGGKDLRLSSFKTGYRPSKRHAEKPLIDRVSLHVSKIALRHPVSLEPIVLEAPAPKDFRAAVYQLGRFARIPR